MVDGERGVVVPGDDGTGPFRLKHQSGTRIEQDREESCDSDEEVANEKFQDLQDEHLQSCKDLAQGVLQEVLMDFAMDSDEIKKEEDKYKAGARKNNLKTKRGDRATPEKRRRGMFALVQSVDEKASESEPRSGNKNQKTRQEA